MTNGICEPATTENGPLRYYLGFFALQSNRADNVQLRLLSQLSGGKHPYLSMGANINSRDLEVTTSLHYVAKD
ncbi:hypothetical protein I7I50_11768 [Histoplasma capsulatum G186AR]|uniref:Uncharacterized protein n=1 Tax=Ajellomyces capsulatus TaxID=5037 RepID=A0A8H7Z613_AJECA|nr:hypothetical protein I7I52_03006 [Histoplasma capsulatum]QSS70210.1 hypothetical protein I7I50_11768 [Histoplasma capsulatum G186AR]